MAKADMRLCTSINRKREKGSKDNLISSRPAYGAAAFKPKWARDNPALRHAAAL